MKIYPASLRYLLTALMILGIGLIFDRAGDCAEPADAGDDQDAEVLTRGPVHEAFAGVVTFNPEPGVVVPKAPPENIEEVPPDEKPAGDNVTWIPGYWAWDDERNDFLWVSGVWRALPPGRQWVPGYWAKTAAGFQWTSGYWADARASETTYLPAPPATLEAGPNIAAPSPDYYWVPGCWVWYYGRYAWRPGYWVVGQPDWVWCPAYYVWTPRGYVFVEGYWDYAVAHRGVLFAPVYYHSPVYVRHGYYYSPTVVIDLTVFPDHLFYRPHYHHCYFGDYYAASYYRAGFFASFSFHSRHRGYDPIYAHRHWEHRHDRDWRRNVTRDYQYRRDHQEARPPRTWNAQRSATVAATSNDRSLAVATSFDQLSKQTDRPVRMQPVAKEEKQRIVQRKQEVVKSREARRTVESQAVDTSPAEPGKQKHFKPSKAKLPQSPIISPSSDQPVDDQTPPRTRQVIRPDTKVEPKRETPQTNVKHDDRPAVKQAPPVRRATPPVVQPAPVRSESAPTVQPPTAVQPPAREKVRDADRGEGHGEGKGRDKGEVQSPPPSRRESSPTVQPPPSHREPPPEAQQPTQHEVKPKPDRPAKEKARDSDKGEGHGQRKGQDKGEDHGDRKGQDKDEQQPPAPPVK